MTSPTLEAYDTFDGASFDASKWQYLQYPMPNQDAWVCCEPQARIGAKDGRLTVGIDRFELEHPVQIVDNCKFVLLSTETFAVPETGAITVTGEMFAEGVGTQAHDWQDGFASLIVIDPSTGWVFDICATSEAVGAIHERLPIGPDVHAFTHVVEAPLAGVQTTAGQVHQFQITLDAAAQTVTWDVDGVEIFWASGVEIPAAINLGLGIFTLRPVTESGSRSLRGQGFKAGWSNLTVSTR
jgi:hypothetical protein